MIKTCLEASIVALCMRQPKKLESIFVILRADSGRYDKKYVGSVCRQLSSMGLLKGWRNLKTKGDHRYVTYITTPEGVCQLKEWNDKQEELKLLGKLLGKGDKNKSSSGTTNENLSKYLKREKSLDNFLP